MTAGIVINALTSAMIIIAVSSSLQETKWMKDTRTATGRYDGGVRSNNDVRHKHVHLPRHKQARRFVRAGHAGCVRNDARRPRIAEQCQLTMWTSACYLARCSRDCGEHGCNERCDVCEASVPVGCVWVGSGAIHRPLWVVGCRSRCFFARPSCAFTFGATVAPAWRYAISITTFH